jgi:signal transduction histidine kinase
MTIRPTRTKSGFVSVSTLFKSFILFGTVAIAALFVIYTQFLIDQLQEYVKRDVRMWAKLWELAGAEESSPRLNAVIFEEIIQKAYFPIIVMTPDREPVLWARIEDVPDNDRSPESLAKIREHKERMEQENGVTAVTWDDRVIQYIVFDYPPLVSQLQVMPFVEIGVVAVFLLVGFAGFRNLQRSEQNRLWVGLAKETAHQLGTPISSLLGWIEVMRQDIGNGKLGSTPGCSAEIEMVVSSMERDIHRLDQVACRFGQIGSTPDTERHDLNELLRGLVEYFRARLPRAGKGAAIDLHPGADVFARVNPELFGWVIENLIKNSLQACNGRQARIAIHTSRSRDGKHVQIAVTDNGAGIPPAIQGKIFQTGFSTKKRGWGLGLALARRIVEEYHRGKIELKESVLDERTTFQITLAYARGEAEGKDS